VEQIEFSHQGNQQGSELLIQLVSPVTGPPPQTTQLTMLPPMCTDTSVYIHTVIYKLILHVFECCNHNSTFSCKVGKPIHLQYCLITK
jgi:hypothetical protein